MSVLRPLRMSAPAPKQRSLESLAAWLGMDLRTASGIAVTEQTSLRLATVYACVRLIAQSLASLPLNVFRRLGRGKIGVDGDPRFALLHDQPNPAMTSLAFRETITGHCLLWGNGYAWLERGRQGRVVALWPVRPDKVKVEIQRDGTPKYVYEFRGEKLEAPSSSILHVQGLGFDGVTGYSPIGLLKESIAMGLAAEKFGATFFGNSACTSGILTTTARLDDDAVNRLRESWETMHGGDSRWRVAVLEDGLTWQQIGVKPDEAQFLETRQFQAAEIARAFNVPPWMVGLETKGMTYSNVEQQQIAFVVHTLRPWLVRWEQALKAKLFPEPDMFAEFNADAIQRGDLKARYDAYSIGHNRWLTTNEIRARENLNPLEGGDELKEPAPAPAPTPPAAEMPRDHEHEHAPDEAHEDGNAT